MRSIVALALAFVLFFVGLAGLAFAFRFEGAEAIVFVGGLLSICVAFAIPFNVLPAIEKPAR